MQTWEKCPVLIPSLLREGFGFCTVVLRRAGKGKVKLFFFAFSKSGNSGGRQNSEWTSASQTEDAERNSHRETDRDSHLPFSPLPCSAYLSYGVLDVDFVRLILRSALRMSCPTYSCSSQGPCQLASATLHLKMHRPDGSEHRTDRTRAWRLALRQLSEANLLQQTVGDFQ